MSVPLVELGQVCRLDRRATAAAAAIAAGLDFVGMEHVDPTTGRISTGNGSRTGEGKGPAFLFDERHVLFGKLRPYLRKIALPMSKGCSSMELVPLLPEAGKLDRAYLFHWLRQPQVARFLMAKHTGARMPRADMSLLLGMSVPLPPLVEQRRLASLFDRAAEVRRRAEVARSAARSLVPALFLQTFGDPRTNPNNWPVVPISAAGEVKLGRQRAPKYQSGAFTTPYVRVANVYEDRIDISDLLSMDFNVSDFETYKLECGDILLNEGQSIELVGRPAMWRDEILNCCFQNTLVRFRPDRTKVTPTFSLQLFLWMYRGGELSKISSKTSNVAHLGAARFGKLAIFVPPLALQIGFSEQVHRVEAIAARLEALATKAEAMAAGLSAEAFG